MEIDLESYGSFPKELAPVDMDDCHAYGITILASRQSKVILERDIVLRNNAHSQM